MDFTTPPTGSEPQPAEEPVISPAVVVDPEGGKRKDVEDNKDLAALSYLWVLSVIVFLARGKSPFVRFHAKQGMVLFAASIIVFAIPYVGKLLALLVLVGIVMGFIHAAGGQWKDVPMVGPLSRGDTSTVRQDWRRVVQSLQEFWKHMSARMRKANEDYKASKAAATPPPPSPGTPPTPPTPPAPSAPPSPNP